ncbi:Nramp-domain-containing protein [Imleria badia]|nr:Nramp-domain-containing protein [Imleria badia]
MLPSLPLVAHNIRRHLGPGIICSVGYFDPSVLATRLGCVTGLDLAAHCRILLHDHPKHPRLVRFLLFYPLYLLGSAIGLILLFPALPVWAGVLLTALDVFVFLLITDHSHPGRPVRLVEIGIIFLVAAVFVSFIVLVIRVNPVWSQAFLGFVPSKELFETRPNAIYAAIGIIGATVMPHGLFLGSHFATQDRLSSRHPALPSPIAPQRSSLQSSLRQRCRNIFAITRTNHDDCTDKSTPHEFVDIIFSLLVVAVPINAAILIISVAVPYDASTSSSAGIFNMYDLILNTLGKGAALIFALALVFSGQAASITATMAGQPFLRRLMTRLLSPLSIVLQFVAFPLIYLTSSKTVMSVDIPKTTPEENDPTGQTPTIDSSGNVSSSATPSKRSAITVEEINLIAIDKPGGTSEAQPLRRDTIDFSNSYVVSAVAYAIWLIISVANVYGIAILGLSG